MIDQSYFISHDKKQSIRMNSFLLLIIKKNIVYGNITKTVFVDFMPYETPFIY